MADDVHRLPDDPHSLKSLEATISAAGQYVRPSDELRPRVLEAARERAGQRQTLWRLGAMMVAATLCVMTGVSVSSRLQARADSAAMPRGERLNQLLITRDAETGDGPEWALAEIIGSWRSDLAARLGENGSEERQEVVKRQVD